MERTKEVGKTVERKTKRMVWRQKRGTLGGDDKKWTCASRLADEEVFGSGAWGFFVLFSTEAFKIIGKDIGWQRKFTS